MTTELQLDNYLTHLRLHLSPLTIADREEIVREIEAHVRDSAEESGATIGAVLARLGPAEALAAQYRDGLLIRAASRSLSPLVLLRATIRLASKGIFGIPGLSPRFARIFYRWWNCIDWLRQVPLSCAHRHVGARRKCRCLGNPALHTPAARTRDFWHVVHPDCSDAGQPCTLFHDLGYPHLSAFFPSLAIEALGVCRK